MIRVAQRQAVEPEAVRRLQERVGSELYRRRLPLERGRLREYYQPLSRKMTALKVRIIRPALVLGLRLSGLYQRGYRQFHNLCVRENSLSIPRLPPEFEGYTILQLSDLHIDIDPGLVDSVIEAVAPLRYDLCVMTGDFRNSTIGEWQDVIPPMRQLMAQLTAPAYAILGNHDFMEMVPALEELGLQFLLNESIALKRNGRELYLVGIDDPNIYATHDLPQALQGVPPDAVRLLLSHSPVIYREAAAHGIEAVLAGHTHGGQVCLPGGIILSRNDKSPRHLLKGAWRYRETVGYTSVGTGSCGIPVRFNCPPEVTLHRLTL